MPPNNQASKYLYPGNDASTEQRICSSLTDLFQFMFNLSLSTSSRPPQRDDFIPAHIMLCHGSARVCVSLHISRQAAMLIAHNVGLTDSPDVGQDVACEIVNIVGNNLRTFYSENLGVLFTLDLPIPREVDEISKPDIFLNLDFEATPEALISVDFLCCEGSMPQAASLQ